jgi:hypothetical protein
MKVVECRMKLAVEKEKYPIAKNDIVKKEKWKCKEEIGMKVAECRMRMAVEKEKY